VDVERLMTDMPSVAHTFGKRHKNVLRAYDTLQCSAEFSRLNFEPSDYIDERGKPQRMIKMTKDGFAMLLKGFTGEAAMAFMETYIATFNAMAAEVATHRQSLWQQMQALIAQQSASKVRTSFGSHLM
jgi:Rha family phage regulatory protein